MAISKALLDELLSGVENADDLLGNQVVDEGAQGPADGADAWRKVDRASGL
jgi:hypothetical protein